MICSDFMGALYVVAVCGSMLALFMLCVSLG